MNKYVRCLPFRSQLTVVSRKDFDKVFTKRIQIPKWGYINRKGEEIVPLNLDSASEFHDGLAAVEKDGQGGYIDENGEFVIKLGHADINGGRAFSDGLAPASTGRIWHWGYIDTSGSWVIAPTFKDANIFRGQLAFVEKRNSVGYVNRQGRLVFEIDKQKIGR